MKKIIITRSQLFEGLGDNLKTQVTFTGDNANEMGNNAQEKYNDAVRGGLKPGAIQMSGKSLRNNATDKDEVTIGFDKTQSNIRGAVTNAVQNAVNNGADINKLNVVDNSEDISNGVAEGKTYSKKQIEQARLYEMRRTGKVMTKKQLSEEILTRSRLQELAFGCDSDYIKEKLSKMNVFEALDAFRQTFGDEALQALSTSRNTVDAIIETFCNADQQKKDEFIGRLDGTYQDEPIDLDIEL